MISVDEATSIILSHQADFGVEWIPLSQSQNRILRQNLLADRDFPPFDRVTMDGIAISLGPLPKVLPDSVKLSPAKAAEHRPKAKSQSPKSIQSSNYKGTTFKIADIAAAGAPQKSLLDPNQCIEVMTGAILPKNTDAVIRYEDVTIHDGNAIINIDQIKPQQNIHHKGSDGVAGTELVHEGIKISGAEIGVAATIGQAEIKVSRLPTIAIISTGDELVDVGQNPLDHQIRKSNVHSIAALIQPFGIAPMLFHFDDDVKTIRDQLREIMDKFPIILLSGGVSKGKFDFIPEVLAELEVEKHFHKVSQRPGKPFWFGSRRDHNFVFAFPGNPNSTFMCARRYFVPWLEQSLRWERPSIPFAQLASPLSFRPDLTLFQQCSVHFNEDAQLVAMPVKGNGSGDLASLTSADGFLELPSDRIEFKRGECFRFWGYR